MCLPANASNTMVNALCGVGPLSLEIAYRLHLPHTDNLQKLQNIFQQKLDDIPLAFFQTPAMCQNQWKQAINENRHVVTRHAVHGYHHRICSKTFFHQATLDCVCKLCGTAGIGKYHILNCSANNISLTVWSKM